MTKRFNQFEERKQAHIDLALRPETEATGLSGLESVTLVHNALPDINFDEISLEATILNAKVQTPFMVSSMTAGHKDGAVINERLINACDACGWSMGVGSQRRELEDASYLPEWSALRKKYPNVRLLGNLGIAQLIHASLDDIQRLIDNLQACALQIHLNPLQECIQPEGTTHFKGALKAIERLARYSSVPIVIKETGCGFSEETIRIMENTGIKALDISGFGGTHWGRIEGLRSHNTMNQRAAKTFQNWGISTLDSMKNALKARPPFEIWGSGGIRSGLDAAKLLALGVTNIGFAKPMMQAAQHSTDEIITLMSTIAFELKVAMFCTGFDSILTFKEEAHVTFRA